LISYIHELTDNVVGVINKKSELDEPPVLVSTEVRYGMFTPTWQEGREEEKKQLYEKEYNRRKI